MIPQKHIDNGFIGGIINTVIASMFIFTLMNPLTFILVLNNYILEKMGVDIPLWIMLFVGTVLYGIWICVFFVYLQKSMQKQNARQTCIGTDHPIMLELEKANQKIDQLLKQRHQ